jgi:predicted nucleic acid-binding protein
MNGKAFFDTNVLLYLLSADQAKADRAEALIAERGTISVQVLNEFAAVAIRKLRLPWSEANESLDTLTTVCAVEALTLETHRRGRELAQRHGLQIYDAMIVASALLAGCSILYSEDMQAGLLVERQLKVINPFAAM